MFTSKKKCLLFLFLTYLLALSSLLSSCQFSPKESQLPAPVEQLTTTPTIAPAVLTAQQKKINALLNEASYALSQNKLLNPVNDNAHDRYRSVLLMDANNERAKLGLETIALRYVEMAKASAVRGDVSNAQAMIKYARQIDNNDVVQDAAETIRKQVAISPAAKVYSAKEGEQLLDGVELKAKSSLVVEQLHSIAKKAKKADSFVLIVARNDAEGRWIYQQLRSAVPGFLVRGDIKIGQPARVKLVDSLE